MPNLYAQYPGVPGVRQTLTAMRELVNRAVPHPLIRYQAFQAMSGCPKGGAVCYCHAALGYVRANVRYFPDPRGVESLVDPVLIAEAVARDLHPFGDCDDLSMYLAALLKAGGLAPVLVAVGRNQTFTHVLVHCAGQVLDPARDLWEVRESVFTDSLSIPV